ncbi:hypothetical protein [Pseudomonas sp. RA_35y_Pfl2_P32]|uniref:hypothetical protein n=1 Tax=Pseudomonas sp. RA_35y_Pfl2_P32 TaxID=3088705 RepID=UPI0030D7ADE9
MSHDRYSIKEFVGFGAARPPTGLASVGQGAQFSVPGANFEAVFSSQFDKKQQFSGLLCQALDRIGYDSGFVLSGLPVGHALVRPRIL